MGRRCRRRRQPPAPRGDAARHHGGHIRPVAAAEILVRKSRLFSTPYALFTQGLSQQTVSPVMVHGADYSVYSGEEWTVPIHAHGTQCGSVYRSVVRRTQIDP